LGGGHKSVKLGEVAEFAKGKGISKADIADEGATPCIRYGELYTHYGTKIDAILSATNVRAEELRLSSGGEVIVPASGEDAKDIATASVVLRSGVALGGDLNIIRGDFDGLFLASYISGKRRLALAAMAQGNSVVHLYPSQLATLDLRLPSLPEQKKIAVFLGVVDAKIAALRARRAGLECYKRGLMQALFSQTLRFTKPDGTSFPDWKKRNLSFYLTEPKARNRGLAFSKNDVLSVSGDAGCINQIEHMGRSYAGVSVKDYHIVQTNDVVYTKSPLKRNPYGIIKTNFGRDGIVSTLYAVYRPTDKADALFIHYYFSLDDNLNRYLRPIVRKGAKNDMKVNNFDVLGDPVHFPSREEQQKIADALSAMDGKIAAVSGQVTQMEAFKSGLLQQMFV
jgi:type I restriction enzyme S subunit